MKFKLLISCSFACFRIVKLYFDSDITYRSRICFLLRSSCPLFLSVLLSSCPPLPLLQSSCPPLFLCSSLPVLLSSFASVFLSSPHSSSTPLFLSSSSLLNNSTTTLKSLYKYYRNFPSPNKLKFTLNGRSSWMVLCFLKSDHSITCRNPSNMVVFESAMKMIPH